MLTEQQKEAVTKLHRAEIDVSVATHMLEEAYANEEKMKGEVLLAKEEIAELFGCCPQKTLVNVLLKDMGKMMRISLNKRNNYRDPHHRDKDRFDLRIVFEDYVV